jgi:hypothetical protein
VNREPAADDEVQRVSGIRFVEDDFAALERSAAGYCAGTAKHRSNVQAIASATALYRRVHALRSGH